MSISVCKRLAVRFSIVHLRRWVLALACLAAAPLAVSQVSGGFSGSLDASEADVLKATKLIVNDTILYGTYSYEKEKQLQGAKAAESAPVFGDAPGDGKVFYKIAENVLAPRHFHETADMGTIYVRYIVSGTGPNTTAIQINAVYVEKTRRRQHASDGAVEEAEFRAIKDRLEKIQELAKPVVADAGASDSSSVPVIGIGSAPESVVKAAPTTQDVEAHISELKRRVEMRTSAGGAALKAAPYRTAATLEPLPAETELLIVVLTKYWYGVETTDGHRGWIHRSQVEALP